VLTPRLVYGDRRRVGQVEGPSTRGDRDDEPVGDRLVAEYLVGKTVRLSAEQQRITSSRKASNEGWIDTSAYSR
jgi:hypothetical protein